MMKTSQRDGVLASESILTRFQSDPGAVDVRENLDLICPVFNPWMLRYAHYYEQSPIDEAGDMVNTFWEWFIRTEKIEKFDPRKGIFTNWFVRVFKNNITDQYRKRRINTYHESASMDGDHEAFAKIPDPKVSNPLEIMVNAETRSEIDAELKKLPTKQRDIVQRILCDEIPLKTVASESKRSSHTMKSRYVKGRTILRKRLKSVRDELKK